VWKSSAFIGEDVRVSVEYPASVGRLHPGEAGSDDLPDGLL
jgi:hypothetical protein